MGKFEGGIVQFLPAASTISFVLGVLQESLASAVRQTDANTVLLDRLLRTVGSLGIYLVVLVLTKIRTKTRVRPAIPKIINKLFVNRTPRGLPCVTDLTAL